MSRVPLTSAEYVTADELFEQLVGALTLGWHDSGPHGNLVRPPFTGKLLIEGKDADGFELKIEAPVQVPVAWKAAQRSRDPSGAKS